MRDWWPGWNALWDSLVANSEVLGFLVTLGLLLITLIYTQATRRMAKTSEEAAQDSKSATASAERSALAALEAARVAQSRIVVEFEGRILGLGNGPKDPALTMAVQLTSTGDAVVVSKVRIRRAYCSGSGGIGLEDEPRIEHEDMAPCGETTLPRRIHRGERIHVTHPGIEDYSAPWARFMLEVHYTFSEQGGEGGRRVVVVDHDDALSS